MAALALVPRVAEVRQCMNCGRPQDHRWHHRDPNGWGALSNGCTYVLARPQTLWREVLQEAVSFAAQDAGVSYTQAIDELMREFG